MEVVDITRAATVEAIRYRPIPAQPEAIPATAVDLEMAEDTAVAVEAMEEEVMAVDLGVLADQVAAVDLFPFRVAAPVDLAVALDLEAVDRD